MGRLEGWSLFAFSLISSPPEDQASRNNCCLLFPESPKSYFCRNNVTPRKERDTEPWFADVKTTTAHLFPSFQCLVKMEDRWMCTARDGAEQAADCWTKTRRMGDPAAADPAWPGQPTPTGPQADGHVRGEEGAPSQRHELQTSCAVLQSNAVSPEPHRLVLFTPVISLFQ